MRKRSLYFILFLVSIISETCVFYPNRDSNRKWKKHKEFYLYDANFQLPKNTPLRTDGVYVYIAYKRTTDTNFVKKSQEDLAKRCSFLRFFPSGHFYRGTFLMEKKVKYSQYLSPYNDLSWKTLSRHGYYYIEEDSLRTEYALRKTVPYHGRRQFFKTYVIKGDTLISQYTQSKKYWGLSSQPDKYQIKISQFLYVFKPIDFKKNIVPNW